ncbi:hypothetical protein EZH22_18100 [Xanthobacter dioxanivorans]|uniref:DUF3035 domain-containing protein n=1 Tax=Xanthobacter dioxanivorans TaxID=2528964 RepID=A0A974SI56_9HYPH|nr:hypothetical protein [Xanthobacter dioxanivorans]QRG05033.1 hypothetical protein EZH22_18100 [Xanthobacter dioxanivorans]
MSTVPPHPGGRVRGTPFPAAARSRRWRAVLALAVLAGLSACAGSDPLAALAPPNPQVPEVAPDQFPPVGAPPSDRAAPLTPEGQQKLQKDLERAARQQARPLPPVQ